MLDFIAQIAIIITGLASMYLIASQEAKTRMYAAILGMAGEPFWIITALIAEQWGVIILAVIHAATWARVFWKNYRSL